MKRAIPSNWCTYTMFLGLEKLNFDPFLFLVEIHGRPEKRRILQDLPSFPANWQSVPLKRPIYKKKGNIWWSDLWKTLPKAQQTQGLSSATKVTSFLNISTSTSFELASSHARVTSIKSTKQESVSQWVSESVSDKGTQWSDSGPIISPY